MNKISKINAICLVVQSFNVKLTLNQKYIFQSVMNLFGKNVAENFIVMFTFADGGKIQVIDSLLNDLSFSSVKDYLKEPWYFKVNNSAIFSDINDQFMYSFYEMGMKSYEQFLNKIKKLSPKRVKMSQEVIVKRKRINLLTDFLMDEINDNIFIIIAYQDNLETLNSLKNKWSYYNKIEIKRPENDLQKCDSNAITCYYCKKNCQKNFKENELNKSLLFEEGKCFICGCSVIIHSLWQYKYYQKTRKDTIYASSVEFLRRNIKYQLKELFLRTLINFEKLNKNNIELQNYALNPGKGNYENYIELMIQEINDKKLPGFYDEINILNKLKTFLKNIYDSLPHSYSMDDFKKLADFKLNKNLIK